MCIFIRRGLHQLHYNPDCERRILDRRIMAINIISFRSFLCLLFGIQSWLINAEGQGRMIEIHALIGQQVNLTCQLNSTGNVTWHYNVYGNLFPAVYICPQNGQCTPTDDESKLHTQLQFEVTRSNSTSVFSLTSQPPDYKEENLKCSLGNVLVRSFSVKPIDPSKLTSNCSVTSPRSDENGVGSMTLSCEVNSGELDVNLTLEGIGLNVFDDAPWSSQSIKTKTLYFDDFNNVRNASCEAYFPDINIRLSCTYPNIVETQYIVEGNDIIIECNSESDVVYWRFYGSDGIEEDINNRSWLRKGGQSLLIRDISEQDVGKVVVCRIKGDVNQANGTIGFTLISNMSGDNNTSNSEYPATTLTPSAHSTYLVLTLLFLSLWLITTAVFGVLLGCRTKRNKSDTSTIALASGNVSVPNEDSDERETPLVNSGTAARRGPDTLNTNNSAHNPAFEPEVNIADVNNRNRQSNNESTHLYFTLEKSSPSPMNSLPRASAARWEHSDVNLASLDHPQRQSSQSQCYETVGEPNKGATISYDLGEYAVVGGHFQGKGPPDLGEYAEVRGHFQGKGPPDLLDRPSVRKKPERKKVKEDDISRLYSKVNK